MNQENTATHQILANNLIADSYLKNGNWSFWRNISPFLPSWQPSFLFIITFPAPNADMDKQNVQPAPFQALHVTLFKVEYAFE